MHIVKVICLSYSYWSNLLTQFSTRRNVFAIMHRKILNMYMHLWSAFYSKSKFTPRSLLWIFWIYIYYAFIFFPVAVVIWGLPCQWPQMLGNYQEMTCISTYIHLPVSIHHRTCSMILQSKCTEMQTWISLMMHMALMMHIAADLASRIICQINHCLLSWLFQPWIRFTDV